jgi:hypothetical protein
VDRRESMNENISQSPSTSFHVYLTREESAKYLRLLPAMLRDNYKHIPSYKLGGKVLYTREDLDGLVRPQSESGSGWEQKGPRTYLNRREVAEYLRLSPKSLENHPKHIPHHKFGSHVLYIKEELDLIMGLERIILKSKEDAS